MDMTPQMTIVLVTLALCFFAFARELLSVDVVAILVLLILTFTNLIDIRTALAGFSHPAVV